MFRGKIVMARYNKEMKEDPKEILPMNFLAPKINYKDAYTFEERKAKAVALKNKYSDLLPVIIERFSRWSILEVVAILISDFLLTLNLAAPRNRELPHLPTPHYNLPPNALVLQLVSLLRKK